MQTTDLFCILAQIAIGTTEPSEFPGASEEQWTEFLAIARKQGIIAVIFGAIEKLPAEKQPSLRNKLHWIGLADIIVKQNEKITALCQKIDKEMAGIGIRSCILKGQGMATYYPNPLYRNSGDIDLWVQLETPTDDFEADVKELLKRVASLGKGEPRDPGQHHAEWEVEGVSVELHYRSGEFYTKKIDKRYHKIAKEEFKNIRATDAGFHIPSNYFNMVQQMEHLQRHLLFEGIGLRQLCDYSLLLLKSTEEERNKAAKAISYLNMKRTASAFMWIMKHVFNIPDDRLLFAPNEKLGKAAMEETMSFGGNMGLMRDHMPKDQFNALPPHKKFLYILSERKPGFKYAPREIMAELWSQFKVIINNKKGIS